MFKATKEDIAHTTFPFAKWTNMFDQNNDLGDEIKYVFDRQKKESQVGNTLDRPSMLMKKNYVRDTHTKDENLKKG